MSKSAIYHHFESKEALLAAALDEALEGLSSAVDAAADATRGETAYDRLRATVEAAVHILVAHLPAVTLLLRVRGNSPLEQSALERRRHIDEQLARVVQQAADEGDLRDDVDPEVISRLVFGMVNSLVDWYRPDGPISPESIAEAVPACCSRACTPTEPPAAKGAGRPHLRAGRSVARRPPPRSGCRRRAWSGSSTRERWPSWAT